VRYAGVMRYPDGGAAVFAGHHNVAAQVSASCRLAVQVWVVGPYYR
jgi:hypothetical protein